MRASGDDAYNQWVLDMSIVMQQPLNSVTTILFKNAKASNDTTVLNTIRNSETVFFAGGDQSQYYSYWSNTEVQNILQEKIATQTIGGTSAGLAILGNWVYTAVDGSAVSEDVLLDPYHKYIHNLEKKFLTIPFLETIVTDTHFGTINNLAK